MPSIEISQFVNNPVAKYASIQERKNELIFHGYNALDFPLYESKTAVKTAITWLHDNYPSLINFGIPIPEIEKILAEFITLQGKVEITTTPEFNKYEAQPNRLVTLPYKRTILAFASFVALVDNYVRIKGYSESDKARNNPEILEILQLHVPLKEKLMLLLEADKKRAINSLLENEDVLDPEIKLILKEAQKDNSIKTDLMGWKEANKLVVTEMIFPSMFHAKYEEMLLGDLFENDNPVECFFIPTFDPLDISFFNKTSQVPVNILGILTGTLYADNFILTPKEFFYHDLKHGWDRYLLFVKATLQRMVSQKESVYFQDDILNELLFKIDQIESGQIEIPDSLKNNTNFSHKALANTLYLTLFELLHEEGHSLELQDLYTGITKISMYGSEFLIRLRDKIEIMNFFAPKEDNSFYVHLPYLNNAKDMILGWVNDMMQKKQLDLAELKEVYHQSDLEIQGQNTQTMAKNIFASSITFFYPEQETKLTKRIAITGATGFVGGHIVLQALNDGHEVFAIGRDEKLLHRLKNSIPEAYRQRLKLQVLDITLDEDKLINFFEDNQIETIIHAAGQASVKKSYDEVDIEQYKINPEVVKITQTGLANIKVTEVLLNALQNVTLKNGQKPHFHLVSTGDVFSQSTNSIIDENAKRHPNTPYGWTKQYAEERLEKAVADGAISGSITYGPLIFGSNQRPIALIPIVANQFLKNEQVILRGDPERETDAIDVEDFAKIVVQGSVKPTSQNHLERYVISGHRTTIRQIFQYIVDAIKEIKDGEQPTYTIDSSIIIPSDKPIEDRNARKRFPGIYENLTPLSITIKRAVQSLLPVAQQEIIEEPLVLNTQSLK